MSDIRTRFMEKVRVDQESGCWVWIASVRLNGYGQFYADGALRSAHRVSWELANGARIPAGLDIDHLCRNRRCVNPDHLEPVTRRENLRRAPSSPTHRSACVNGHEYTAENTNLNAGYRQCRACWRDRARRAHAKRKALAS